MTTDYDAVFGEIVFDDDGDVAAIQAAIDSGHDINCVDDSDNWNLLHYVLNPVTWQPNVDVVRVLIENGGDVNQPDRRQWTPLHFAARTGCGETLRLLLDAGADPNAADEKGITPLHRYLLRRPIEPGVVQLFIDYGGRPTEGLLGYATSCDYPEKSEVLAILGVTGESVESKQNEPPPPPARQQPPFMEHPGDHKTAVAAMADAIKRLRKLKTWNKWITFDGQGMGGRVDSYKCAAIQMRQGNIRLPEPLEIDLDQVAKRARVPRDRIVRRRKDLYSIADATPRQAARIMDVLYRDYLGIRPRASEGDDYGVIAEWL